MGWNVGEGADLFSGWSATHPLISKGGGFLSLLSFPPICKVPFFPQRGLGLSDLGRFLSLSWSSASLHCLSPSSFVAVGKIFIIVAGFLFA